MAFDVEVSLALGADLTADPGTWSWTDVTAYTDGAVEIQRGRVDEQTQVQASWCRVRLDNADGRFSRLNPVGAYYGQLQKNTPLRIRACEAGGTLVTRFVGYVSEWPPRWTYGQAYQWVPVRADGALRRLSQGLTPVRSALRRAYVLGTLNTGLVLYWPLENATNGELSATQEQHRINALDAGSDDTNRYARAALANFAQFTFGSAGWSSDAPAGSAASVALSSAAMSFARKVVSGRIPAIEFPSPTSPVRIGFAFRFAPDQFDSPLTAGEKECTILRTVDADNDNFAWAVRMITSSSGAVFNLDTFSINDAGTATHHSVTPVSLSLSVWHYITLELSSSGGGADTAYELTFDGTIIHSGTATGVAYADSIGFSVVNAGWDVPGIENVCHFAIWNGSSLPADDAGYEAMQGYAGETDVDRFNRVCDEEGIPHATATGDGVLLGAQPVADAVGVLRDGEAAGEGVLYEALTGQIAYMPLSARYNLDVSLALDYDQGHIVAPFEPTDDDLLTRNDITVNRTNGSSAPATDEDSIAAIGRYNEELLLNLYSDTQVPDHASWRLRLGTVDDYRYPTVTLALHKSTSLVTDWLACDIGSRLTIDNVPANVTPDLVDQVIEGYTERINSVEFVVTGNLSPGQPYRVQQLADTPPASNTLDGWLTPTSFTVDADFDAGTDTSLDVDVTPAITTSAGVTPLRIRALGVLLEVTAVGSPTGSIQTLTVTQTPLNGVVKTLPAGTAIELADPLILTL